MLGGKLSKISCMRLKETKRSEEVFFCVQQLFRGDQPVFRNTGKTENELRATERYAFTFFNILGGLGKLLF